MQAPTSTIAKASLGRNQVFAVRGNVDSPTVLLLGTLTNRRGQIVASSYLTAEFPKPARCPRGHAASTRSVRPAKPSDRSKPNSRAPRRIVVRASAE